MSFDRDKNQNRLRVIQTARSEETINDAALRGLRPLVKKVDASPEIRSKYAIWQNKKTGEIDVCGDYRVSHNPEEWEQVIDWTYYYPNPFASPFAAYLIPGDLVVGERIFLEDIIEDLVGMVWNQGSVYRLESAEAIWNGKDFEIQHLKKDAEFVMG